MTYHIHSSYHARDCDGPYDSWSDYVPDPASKLMGGVDPEDAMDIAMHYVMVLAFKVPDAGPVSVSINVDEQGRYVIESARQTDEGFDSHLWVVCDEDDFDGPAFQQRDHFAEAAGY